MATPSIIFPKCHRIFYHPCNVAERYCDACRQWHVEMRVAEDRRRRQAASREALENLVIAVGIGWDRGGRGGPGGAEWEGARGMTEKVCRCCGEAKPLTAFPVDRRRLDGHRTDCSSCNAASWQERVRNKPEVYAAHLLRQAAARREKYRDDPIFRAKQKARGLANHRRRKAEAKTEP